MFNGADTVIINGGTFIFNVNGECQWFISIENGRDNQPTEPTSHQLEHINAEENLNSTDIIRKCAHD